MLRGSQSPLKVKENTSGPEEKEETSFPLSREQKSCRVTKSKAIRASKKENFGDGNKTRPHKGVLRCPKGPGGDLCVPPGVGGSWELPGSCFGVLRELPLGTEQEFPSGRAAPEGNEFTPERDRAEGKSDFDFTPERDKAEGKSDFDFTPERDKAEGKSDFDFTPERDRAEGKSGFDFTPERDRAEEKSDFDFTPERDRAEGKSDFGLPGQRTKPADVAAVTIAEFGNAPEGSAKRPMGTSPNSLKFRRRSTIGLRGSPENNTLIRFLAQQRSSRQRGAFTQISPFSHTNVRSLKHKIDAFQISFESLQETEAEPGLSHLERSTGASSQNKTPFRKDPNLEPWSEKFLLGSRALKGNLSENESKRSRRDPRSCRTLSPHRAGAVPSPAAAAKEWVHEQPNPVKSLEIVVAGDFLGTEHVPRCELSPGGDPGSGLSPRKDRGDSGLDLSPRSIRGDTGSGLSPRKAEGDIGSGLSPRKIGGETGSDLSLRKDRGDTGSAVSPRKDRGDTGSGLSLRKVTGDPGLDLSPRKVTGDTGSGLSPRSIRGDSDSDLIPRSVRGDTDSDLIPRKDRGDTGSSLSPRKVTGDTGSGLSLRKVTGDPGLDLSPRKVTGDTGSGLSPRSIRGDSDSDLIPRKVTGDPGSGLSPRKDRSDPGSGLSLRKDTGDTGSDLSPRKAEGDPGSSLSPRKVTGDPGSSLSPRKDRGDTGSHLSPRKDRGDPGSGLSPRRDRGDPGSGLSPRKDRSDPGSGPSPRRDRSDPASGLSPRRDRSDPGSGPSPRRVGFVADAIGSHAPVTPPRAGDTPSCDLSRSTSLLRSILKKTPGRELLHSPALGSELALQECSTNATDRGGGEPAAVSSCVKTFGTLQTDAAETQSSKTPKKKKVTFGEVLSPEIFDQALPANTPLRRGASPGCPRGHSLSAEPLPLLDWGWDEEHAEPVQEFLENSVAAESPPPVEKAEVTETATADMVTTRSSSKRKQCRALAQDTDGDTQSDRETKNPKKNKIQRQKNPTTAAPRKTQKTKYPSYGKRRKKKVKKSLYGEREIASKKPLLSPIPEIPELFSSVSTPNSPKAEALLSEGDPNPRDVFQNIPQEEEEDGRSRGKRLWAAPGDTDWSVGTGEASGALCSAPEISNIAPAAEGDFDPSEYFQQGEETPGEKEAKESNSLRGKEEFQGNLPAGLGIVDQQDGPEPPPEHSARGDPARRRRRRRSSAFCFPPAESLEGTRVDLALSSYSVEEVLSVPRGRQGRLQQAGLGSPKTRQGSPKTRQGSPKTRQGSPKTRQGSPKTWLRSPKGGQGSPKGGQGSLQLGQGSIQAGQGSPRRRPGSPKARPRSPQGSQGSPKARPRSPQGSQGSPKARPRSPQGSQGSPQGCRRRSSGRTELRVRRSMRLSRDTASEGLAWVQLPAEIPQEPPPAAPAQGRRSSSASVLPGAENVHPEQQILNPLAAPAQGRRSSSASGAENVHPREQILNPLAAPSTGRRHSSASVPSRAENVHPRGQILNPSAAPAQGRRHSSASSASVLPGAENVHPEQQILNPLAAPPTGRRHSSALAVAGAENVHPREQSLNPLAAPTTGRRHSSASVLVGAENVHPREQILNSLAAPSTSRMNSSASVPSGAEDVHPRGQILNPSAAPAQGRRSSSASVLPGAENVHPEQQILNPSAAPTTGRRHSNPSILAGAENVHPREQILAPLPALGKENEGSAPPGRRGRRRSLCAASARGEAPWAPAQRRRSTNSGWGKDRSRQKLTERETLELRLKEVSALSDFLK